MISIKTKLIPPQPRNKKYYATTASGGIGSGSISISSGGKVTNTIVVLSYTDVEYDVD
jgi:hypothetical protein